MEAKMAAKNDARGASGAWSTKRNGQRKLPVASREIQSNGRCYAAYEPKPMPTMSQNKPSQRKSYAFKMRPGSASGGQHATCNAQVGSRTPKSGGLFVPCWRPWVAVSSQVERLRIPSAFNPSVPEDLNPEGGLGGAEIDLQRSRPA